ncbi:MAG: DUF5684 domain-containing protein [Planctomycetota bacterium]
MMSNPEDLIAALLMLLWFVGLHVGMAAVFSNVQIPAWHAFVPFLNGYQLCRTAGVSGWWLLAIFIPLANLALVLYLGLRLSQRFGFADWFGVILGFSGLGLLPIIGFRAEAAFVEPAFNPAQPQHSNAPIAPAPLTSRRSTFIALLVLSMVQLVCLLCVPGLMIVGVMAFDSVQKLTPEMEFSIAIAAFIPLSILGALIGQWIWYSVKQYKLALGMTAVPILNVVALIASVVLWLDR